MHLRRYLISGILTVIPLWVTWVLFEFVFRQLSQFGMPWVQAFSREIQADSPIIARLLLEPWLQNIIAVLLVLSVLYLLGWTVNRVVGRRLLRAVESIIERLPLIQTVYRSARQLIAVLQQRPADVQRVVLIEFPSSDMKAVGLVTRTLTDQDTGEKLVAVYVPTTPNPTSGYIEIVPIDRVTSTDWTVEEAMNFLVSGGAVGPDTVRYHNQKPVNGNDRSSQ